MVSTVESVRGALRYLGHSFVNSILTEGEYIKKEQRRLDFIRLREWKDKKKTLRV